VFHRRDAAPRRLPWRCVQATSPMGDDVRCDSLAEALKYIATESEQAGVWALKRFEKLGARRKRKLGARRKSKGPFFSKPPAPDEIQKLISQGFGLSLLGDAIDAVKEEGRRGLKCWGTDPCTGERREIKADEWPHLYIPAEAAFNAEGEVFTEVKGVSIVAYGKVTVDGLDLERRFPRSNIEKMAPPPVPAADEPVPVVSTASPVAKPPLVSAAKGKTAPAPVPVADEPVPAQSVLEVQLEPPPPATQPDESAVADTTKPVADRKRMKRRGPEPGTIDRFGDDDRALFPQVTRLMKKENLSRLQAATRLANASKVAGIGTIESRARRLADRYRDEVEN
jgi:hypothetical protein